MYQIHLAALLYLQRTGTIGLSADDFGMPPSPHRAMVAEEMVRGIARYLHKAMTSRISSARHDVLKGMTKR